MREITEHKVNPANEKIGIYVTDAPGAGGANHRYVLTGIDYAGNASLNEQPGEPDRATIVLFQNGPIPESGVNGLTHEALLAIVADRLRSFQAGNFACPENAHALYHVENAMQWLHNRTKQRVQRGVEGTHEV